MIFSLMQHLSKSTSEPVIRSHNWTDFLFTYHLKCVKALKQDQKLNICWRKTALETWSNFENNLTNFEGQHVCHCINIQKRLERRNYKTAFVLSNNKRLNENNIICAFNAFCIHFFIVWQKTCCTCNKKPACRDYARRNLRLAPIVYSRTIIILFSTR